MRVLDKKLLRNIRKSWGQALAITMVILCGTAAYISMASAHRNLLLTRNSYYAHYRFADFQIMLERAPTTAVFKVENLHGLREARGRIVKEVNLDIEGVDEPRIGRIISMPDRDVPVLNDICLVSGRYFEPGASNEVILSDAFARENRLGIGDRIRASINDKKQPLRIVGTAQSPEYIYMIRNAQEFIPSPARFGVLWVAEEFAEMAFDMNAARNDIIGAVNDPNQLEEILDKAEKLLEPYGVFATIKREDQISHRFLSDEIKGLEVTARIIPAIFQGIAALIILVLLNRMVKNERTQIGLLKAYGYSHWTVSAHYLKFALILGIAGCLGGFAVGQWLANAMIELYVEFFQFPVLRSRMYPDVLIRAAGITLAFALLGALTAARQAARIQPAEAMRPAAPRSARRTVFERVEVVWRNLSFTWKMIVRNVSRYRFRAFLSVFGVMLSAGIMLLGLFTMDAVYYMLDFQFQEVQREDVRITLATERGKGALHEIARLDYVRHAEPILQYPFEFRSKWRKKDVAITGLPQNAQLMRLIDTQGRTVNIGDRGLVISERLATDLGVQPGDAITIKPLLGRITKKTRVLVSQVARQYLGMSAYMNLDALSRILEEPFAMNAALVRTERRKERALNRTLKDVPAVASVEIKRESYQSIKETLAESMRISSTFLALFSGIIAFAIIYNSTSVSLAERQRELASLRVMGFTMGEVGGIIYNENFLLAAVGLLAGYPFGMLMCKLIVVAYETELYRIPFHIEPRTFTVTGVLTVLFVVLANLAARRRIRALDVVEVLKARE